MSDQSKPDLAESWKSGGAFGIVGAGCRAVHQGSVRQAISSVCIGGMERRMLYQVSGHIDKSIIKNARPERQI